MHEPLRLIYRTPVIVRVFIAGIGIAFLATAPAERDLLFGGDFFAVASWSFRLVSVAVGLLLVWIALIGEETVLEVRDGAIRRERRNPFRRSETLLAAGDIRDISIREVEWESGPDTYAVVVQLARGRPVWSDGFGRREDAEAQADRPRKALGRA